MKRILSYFFITISMVMAMLGCIGCSNGKDATLELSSEEDLKGHTLAVTNGSYYHQKYTSLEGFNTFTVNAESDGVQAVRQGLADVYVSDEVLLTKEDLQRLNMKRAFRGEESFDVAFAVRKGNSDLLEKLNAFIESAPVDQIIAHWTEGGPDVPESAYEIDKDAEPLWGVSCTNMSPICFAGEGGEWMGMDPDILRRFAHSLGRPFKMKYQDFGGAILAIQTGQVDVFSSCLFVTEERKKNVDFTIPYYHCHPGYFVADKSNKTHMGLGERLKMNLVTESRWKLITDGLLETLKITLLSILLGAILGIGVCAAKRSRHKWLRSAESLYSAFIAGIPTLVLLLIMFYVVFAKAGISPSLVAVVTFALCFASSAGNIFDTAISSVPAGQTEAGLGLGFTPFQTFTGIVFPQALKKGLPLFEGECISLLKSTSIVGYIAIQDLTRASDLIRSRTFDALIPLLIVTVVYFVLAWLIRVLLNLFLKK